ncbi:MAG: cysteine desulfurase [Spirochaetaceae bacterium]|nr:MAG: cysteine desulfurase [Spirochaetaceae bacterium]
MSSAERPIYLDYNATTPHDPEVVQAMRPFLESEFGNPSSSHVYGSRPRQAVADARQHVAALIGAAPENIVFTSGGTESNNYAILGSARALRQKGHHIITSNIEHPAVSETFTALESEGFTVTRLPVDEFGMVAPEEFESAIRPDTILVSIMHANNEIGTIEPIEAIARIASRHGVLVHTDAAQSVGKIPVDVTALGVDMLTIAGHKLYAPKGVGALYLRSGVEPQRIMHGGGQEGGYRAGTENVLEVVGLGAACRIAKRDFDRNRQAMLSSRDLLHERITADCDVRLNGHPQLRLPNTLNVSFRGVTSDALIAAVADVVAVSVGSACHSDAVALSPVIEAIGTAMEWARGTIRFSTGKLTTAAEIERAAGAINRAYASLVRGSTQTQN